MYHAINYFIQDFLKAKSPFSKVLDVGSKDFNGSVRDSFREAGIAYEEFIGVDMQPGKGVDIVRNGHDLLDEFLPNTFDLVTCCETFEHDDKFWVTLSNMKKLVKPGGYLLITVPGIFFIHHDFPGDYYRFTKTAVKSWFKGYRDVHIEEYIDQYDQKEKPNTSIMAYGRKPK